MEKNDKVRRGKVAGGYGSWGRALAGLKLIPDNTWSFFSTLGGLLFIF